jgi:hypothetical protein
MERQRSQVAIKFLHDVGNTAESFRCAAGAEYLVDAASASAFILAGIAIQVAQSQHE